MPRPRQTQMVQGRRLRPPLPRSDAPMGREEWFFPWRSGGDRLRTQGWIMNGCRDDECVRQTFGRILAEARLSC